MTGSHAEARGALPVLECTDFGGAFEPTCLANGLVGTTPGPNPLLPGRAMVSGFVYSHPLYGFESSAPAPYPLGLEVAAKGRKPAPMQVRSQSLDLATGELHTSMVPGPGAGMRCTVEVTQFASRSVPSLVCQEVRFQAEAAGEILLTTRIHTEGAAGEVRKTDTDPLTRGWYEEDLIDRCLEMRTDRGALGVATVVMRRPEVTKRGLGTYAVKIPAGGAAVFRHVAAMVPLISSPDPLLEAIRMARWGEMLGFETLRAQNRDAWRELWMSRPRIAGNLEDQRATDVAFYYYHTSIHPSSRAGIPPFGLAQHDKYYGHNFWDTDLWLLLPAILTAPHAARAIAEYRFRGLEAAKRKAALFGYRGAQYPWEAAVDGSEVTPSCCPTGWSQQHVNPGVAVGAWEFQLAAGDGDTLHRVTWPILEAIAEWIESRGHFTSRGFEIDHMMGPDEGITNLSNQTYFNLLARMAIDAAVACARMVGRAPHASWRRIRDRIVIPTDAKGVVLPFDLDSTVRIYNPALRVFEEKPAAGNIEAYSLGNLHFLFVHGLPVPVQSFRTTWLREEEIRLARTTGGGVVGSPQAPGFTSPPYAVCAAYFGERAKAAALFRASRERYWMEPYGMTKECIPHDYGGYVTNHGSTLQSVLLGFTGLRVAAGRWTRHRAALPEGWDRIEVDRIWIRGSAYRLEAEHGKRARLTKG
jgi:protein-glucosylgalactosylhydroxylysine glucosidase